MTVENGIFWGSLEDLFPMGIVFGLSSDPRLTGVHFTLICRTCRDPTGNNTIPTCQFPSAANFERADTSGDNNFARKCALVSNSMNGKQLSDDLSNPSLY